MELEITHLIGSDDFCPFDLSNNRATLGDNAGALTWAACVETATEIAPPLLDTDEKRQAFRNWVGEFGAWDEDKILTWSDTELNALLLQFIAGDIREAFGDDESSEWDWDEYQKDAESGRIAGRICKGDDSKVYIHIGT